MHINEFWYSTNQKDWLNALDNYWASIGENNIQLEQEMDNLEPNNVQNMNQQEWYNFLLNKYFRWKYQPNRYATTTKYFKKYQEENRLNELYDIKNQIFAFDKENIMLGLKIKIEGMGVPGRSGLLSLLFPNYFGTVDQFVVKALRNIEDLPEKEQLLRMKPEKLEIDDGVILIKIMRQKSIELNNMFGTNFWTPRKIDMILWSCRD
ncbi:hypothetical protein COT07_00650 [Candidatus Woesearchaeota archaeon CG07_land_8_20_14_0_80_44_23]|nr:MAG: hypothetical protein COT07_00650 [Candidatus Woesearchaeota archaeon CG07_land_8_20_14_0_80_44_23]